MSSLTETDNPVAEKVITVGAPSETNHGTSSTTAFLYACLATLYRIFNLAARRPIASLGRLWTNYFPRGALGEEGVIMPGSALGFIIAGLLNFAEIKSQGQAEFPFHTHPQAIMVAITSLLMYGLASAAEQLYLQGCAYSKPKLLGRNRTNGDQRLHCCLPISQQFPGVVNLAATYPVVSLCRYGLTITCKDHLEKKNHRVLRTQKLTPGPAPPPLLHDHVIVYIPLRNPGLVY